MVASLPAEDGYAGLLSDARGFPRMVYLRGTDVETSDVVVRLIQQIVAVFDSSYGEVIVADRALLDKGWDPRNVRRYYVASGEVRPA